MFSHIDIEMLVNPKILPTLSLSRFHVTHFKIALSFAATMPTKLLFGPQCQRNHEVSEKRATSTYGGVFVTLQETSCQC